jgi:hypothetical protein
MAQAQGVVKSFDSPDEVRAFDGKGQASLVDIAGKPVAKVECEPGWKWSNNIKPIAKTDSCQVSHLGYCIQGRMRIYMDDGSQLEVGAGEVIAIPPGHDAEVIGDEAYVGLDFGEVEAFAKAG